MSNFRAQGGKVVAALRLKAEGQDGDPDFPGVASKADHASDTSQREKNFLGYLESTYVSGAYVIMAHM